MVASGSKLRGGAAVPPFSNPIPGCLPTSLAHTAWRGQLAPLDRQVSTWRHQYALHRVSQSEITSLQHLRGLEPSRGGAGTAPQPSKQDEVEAEQKRGSGEVLAWNGRWHGAS